jgi:hypothetical protein
MPSSYSARPDGVDRVAGVESGRLDKSVAPPWRRTRRHTLRIALLSQNGALLPTQSFEESPGFSVQE